MIVRPSMLSPRIIPLLLCHKDLRRVAIGGFYCHHGHMNTVFDLFRNLWIAMGCIVELLGYLLRFISVFFQTRASLAARLVAAESQLSVCKPLTPGPPMHVHAESNFLSVAHGPSAHP